MVHPKWNALFKYLIEFADKHPFSTIEKLEIADGVPTFLLIEIPPRAKNIITKVKFKV